MKTQLCRAGRGRDFTYPVILVLLGVMGCLLVSVNALAATAPCVSSLGQLRQINTSGLAVHAMSAALAPTRVLEVPPAHIEVSAAASLPTTGIIGLAIVAVACIIAGAFIILRRE